jgi:uncharacterized protein
MPFQAYMNPRAYGTEGDADFVSWVVSFIFIDGKMRGLFSFMFGASMLLVIERAEARGESPASAHFRRMAWLLVFGLLHFYLIWFGDILAGYAMIGMIAWLFRNAEPRKLVKWGLGLIVFQTLVFATLAAGAYMLQEAASAPDATAKAIKDWNELRAEFDVPSAQKLAEILALHRGDYGGLVMDRVIKQGAAPFTGIFLFGWETLGYMVLGMAALKTGFFRGTWSLAAYRKAMLIGFGIGIPAYALLAWVLAKEGFSVPMIFAVAMAGTTPFRPLMIVATGALIIVLTRNGGALVDRFAAAGRAAFTNYLGTSILMTTVFYGYGFNLFGDLSRAELWLVVAAMWVVMLLWSKPWLDRFQYGPLEWLWRSLARWSFQPMRRREPVRAA